MRPGGWVLFVAILWLAAIPWDFPRSYRDAGYERQSQSALVSRAIARDGWEAVFTPRADFAAEHQLERREFVIRYEFPFHGVLTWPLYAIWGTGEAVERVVPLVVALVGLSFAFRLGAALGKRQESGVLAAILLGTAPLYVHLGRVPMPDLFATVLLLAGSLAAWHRRTWASAVLFGAGCLAKASLAPFGLAVLGVLLADERGRLDWSRRTVLRALGWCLVAGLPLGAWIAAGWFDPPGSWSIVQQATAEVHDGFPGDLAQPRFYILVGAYLSAFGIGVLGVLAVLAALTRPMERRVVLLFSLAAVSFVVSALAGPRFFWREPQYALPVVAYLALLAGCGAPGLVETWRRGGWWRSALAGSLVVHLVVAAWCILDLKADRVPDQPAIAAMAQYIPPDGRVVALAVTWGAAPADWLRRNVWAIEDDRPLRGDLLERLRRAGFTHALVFETTQRAGFFGGRRWTEDRARRRNQIAALREDFPVVASSGRAELFDLRP